MNMYFCTYSPQMEHIYYILSAFYMSIMMSFLQVLLLFHQECYPRKRRTQPVGALMLPLLTSSGGIPDTTVTIFLEPLF